MSPQTWEAAALALEAGVDVELPNVNAYGEGLVNLVESGEVDALVVERAVKRVLTQKCELGLLDPDWSPEPPVLQHEAALLDGAAEREMARKLAERSIVLLSNDGSLPLRPGLRVSVVGPGFRSARDARLLFVPHARRRASPRPPGRSRPASITRRNDRRPRGLQDLLRAGLSRGRWATRRGSNRSPRGDGGCSRLRGLRCSPR